MAAFTLIILFALGMLVTFTCYTCWIATRIHNLLNRILEALSKN